MQKLSVKYGIMLLCGWCPPAGLTAGARYGVAPLVREMLLPSGVVWLWLGISLSSGSRAFQSSWDKLQLRILAKRKNL